MSKPRILRRPVTIHITLGRAEKAALEDAADRMSLTVTAFCRSILFCRVEDRATPGPKTAAQMIPPPAPLAVSLPFRVGLYPPQPVAPLPVALGCGPDGEW